MKRVCKLCNKEKYLSDFHKNKNKYLGHKYQCKICCNKYTKKYYNNNKLNIMNHPLRNKGKSFHEITGNKSNNKVARIAHNIVGKALKKSDIIIKNCRICNSNENINAHHDDYNNPLKVKWFCRRHHFKYHRRLNYKILKVEMAGM